MQTQVFKSAFQNADLYIPISVCGQGHLYPVSVPCDICLNTTLCSKPFYGSSFPLIRKCRKDEQPSIAALQQHFRHTCRHAKIAIDLEGWMRTEQIRIVCAYKWKLGKYKYLRICTDFICIILGITMFLLSTGTPDKITAFVGIGTIVTAFCMGPLIDWFNRKVSVPMLQH